MENQTQNIDLPIENPLDTEPKTEELKPKKPLGFKAIVLVIMGIILILLLVVAAFVSISRKNQPTTIIPVTEVTPTTSQEITPIPTAFSSDGIPDELKEEASEIDSYLRTNVEFLPPNIDLDVGI